MNFLNGIGKQISDLFMSMTPSARIMAGLMAAVVVVSLGWIMTGSGSTQYEYLFGGRDYSDAELTAWEAAFGAAQLGDYERIGQRIKIPSTKKDLYLKALSSADSLPREHNSPLKEALYGGNIFDPSSLIDKRTVFARQQQLENTIKAQAGIQKAIVNYDEQRAGFGRETQKVCTVSVQGFNNSPVPPNLLRNFAKMATHTFAGLKLENVTVVDMATSSIIYGSSGDSDENAYFAQQAKWETYYESKVTDLLADYNAKVSVNVTLDPTMESESEQLQYQQQPITISSSTLSKNIENTKGAPGGQPGAGPNGVSNQATSISAAAVGQNSKTKESQENERKLAGHEATVTRKAGLTPKTVTVSIGIPESHYRKVALQKFRLANPDKADADAPVPTDGDLATIRTEEEKAVRSAVETIPVGAREGDDRKAFIAVYSYTDLPTPELPQPAMTDNALAWLANSWSTIALIGLVLVSMGMMFSWLKTPVAAGDTDKRFAEGFGLEIPTVPIDQLDIGDGEGTDAEGRRRPPALEVSGQEMKDDLSTIIKENPDAAVNLIKAWIGEAA